MSFTSLSFIIFMAVLVIVYYIIPKKLQWILLLIASCGFYIYGGGKTILYLLFVAGTS